MEKDYLSAAIKSLCPNSEFSYINEDYSTIKWDVLDNAAPTLIELETEMARLKQLDAQTEADKAVKREALLVKLGITADEAALLLA